MAGLLFYERYGVEEYYLYDPDRNNLSGWMRQEKRLIPIDPITNWVSPCLKIRFDWLEDGLQLYLFAEWRIIYDIGTGATAGRIGRTTRSQIS